MNLKKENKKELIMNEDDDKAPRPVQNKLISFNPVCIYIVLYLLCYYCNILRIYIQYRYGKVVCLLSL